MFVDKIRFKEIISPTFTVVLFCRQLGLFLRWSIRGALLPISRTFEKYTSNVSKCKYIGHVHVHVHFQMNVFKLRKTTSKSALHFQQYMYSETSHIHDSYIHGKNSLPNPNSPLMGIGDRLVFTPANSK